MSENKNREEEELSLVRSYAIQEKANARGDMMREPDKSFKQGIYVGRLNAMNDILELIHENYD